MKKLLLLLVFLTPFALKAQNNLNFDFDYARFGYDSLSNYIEFYYSFGLSNLKIVNKNTGFAANAILRIQIQDTVNNNTILDKEWKVESPLSDTTKQVVNKNLVGVVGFIVPKGLYRCTVTGTDGNNASRSKKIVETVTISPFLGKNLSLSDIELSSNIKQEGADTSSIFYKNTLEVQPNPTMVFGEGIPVLFYYSEIYNMLSSQDQKNITLKTFLFNSKGYKLSDKTKTLTKGGTSRVEVGTMNMMKYPTDTYTLVLTAIDSAANVISTSSKRMFVYNPSVADTMKNLAFNNELISSEYSVLSLEECDDQFEQIKYISTRAEIAQYEKLNNVEAKRDFLLKFWKKRDTDPSTVVNEYKNQYMERVRISDEKYSTINRKGRKTDRGRVYILYGEPDEIDRNPSDIDKKPYEIWHYNSIEGGVIFVFGDISGFSDYQLLHSTKRGELRDDNWESRVTSAQ
ncbi:MAG: GWxTD domain-containing protein [Bacteroidota bacterium]|nr:GWxTD domain-containing protein [Bacteroidota bacterium]MDP4192721.1 GWxTD domain-containing protein [Bacteroidota bacterium]MDP4194425.1 GWxTD domain-containing protein [Bacteroidota bacterium]